MTFTSLEFIIFFPLIILLYNIIPRKLRLLFLLAASYIIYGLLQPMYLVLLIFTSFLTYGIGLLIDRTSEDNRKYRIMVSGIVLILIPLFLFKYLNFVGEYINSLINVNIPSVRWMLPLGISYYTFMSIGYLVDLYNEDVDVERNPLAVALFLSFFPIVFSGPIERAGNMFSQIKGVVGSKYSDILGGGKMMLWGYFMKLCVADRLSMYVNSVYAEIDIHNGSTLGIAALLFPIQEYGDLAGYSLIAIGTARCLGFDIIPNFNRPFFATSISSFWHRWHMSLIQWLTDYIYTPMSYVLRSWKTWGVVASLMVTFFVSGVWHGAYMTCVAWGVLQGILLSIEVFMLNARTKIEKKYSLTSKWWYVLLCCLLVYLIFAFSEIYGMSTSFSDANIIVGKIFTNPGIPYIDSKNLLIGGLMVFILFYKDFADEFLSVKYRLLDSSNKYFRYFSYYFVTMIVLLFAVFDGGQFLYFQF